MNPRIICMSCYCDRFAVSGTNALRCQNCGAVTQITPYPYRETLTQMNQWFRRPVGPIPDYNPKGDK